jgi:hypothetical protein
MKRPYMPFQLEKIGEEKCLEEWINTEQCMYRLH